MFCLDSINSGKFGCKELSLLNNSKDKRWFVSNYFSEETHNLVHMGRIIGFFMWMKQESYNTRFSFVWWNMTEDIYRSHEQFDNTSYVETTRLHVSEQNNLFHPFSGINVSHHLWKKRGNTALLMRNYHKSKRRNISMSSTAHTIR